MNAERAIKTKPDFTKEPLRHGEIRLSQARWVGLCVFVPLWFKFIA